MSQDNLAKLHSDSDDLINVVFDATQDERFLDDEYGNLWNRYEVFISKCGSHGKENIEPCIEFISESNANHMVMHTATSIRKWMDNGYNIHEILERVLDHFKKRS